VIYIFVAEIEGTII